MVRILVLALTLLAAPIAAQAAGFGDYRPAPMAGEAVTTSLYLPMRDGVRIAVSLHRPSKDGKPIEGRFPVIWHNALAIDPAGVGEPKGLAAFTRQGYVVAVVARRGNGASFGVRRGYEDMTEWFDAYEVTEWLAAQPWSNGQVGMVGCSNTGEAVMHALSTRPPHLKAAWAGCFAWDRYDGHTRGGVIAQFGTGPQRTVEEDLKTVPVQGDEAKVLLRQAAEEHLASTNLFELMRGAPFRDSYSTMVMSRFWYEVSMGSFADQVRRSGVPLYIQGGWKDDFRTQGLITLANLPGQARIIIGPWRHCRFDDFDIAQEQLRFFDRHLKGVDTGLDAEPPVRYFTMVGPKGGEWRATAQWPLPAARPQTYHLVAGALADRAPRADRPTAFPVKYDVACVDPVVSGPAAMALAVPCHAAGSGAAFARPPLKTAVEVTGHAIADLWVSSTAKDANIFAYLEDVAPDGSVTVVADGRQRASLARVHDAPWAMLGLPWRRSWKEDEAKLTPGRPVHVLFDFLAASYVFQPGHRIQVTVAGSDYRERGRVETIPPPVITLHASAARPSTVTLPVAP